MDASQTPFKNSNQIRIQRWEKKSPLTQEEAEARLHQEGYHSFCWYDVPGAVYPKHKHDYDECLWILTGQLHLIIEDEVYLLSSGDRIYLSANIPHVTKVPKTQGVTYLVGQKKAPSRSFNRNRSSD